MNALNEWDEDKDEDESEKNEEESNSKEASENVSEKTNMIDDWRLNVTSKKCENENVEKSRMSLNH
jgi:hypothetical protein